MAQEQAHCGSCQLMQAGGSESVRFVHATGEWWVGTCVRFYPFSHLVMYPRRHVHAQALHTLNPFEVEQMGVYLQRMAKALVELGQETATEVSLRATDDGHMQWHVLLPHFPFGQAGPWSPQGLLVPQIDTDEAIRRLRLLLQPAPRLSNKTKLPDD